MVGDRPEIFAEGVIFTVARNADDFAPRGVRSAEAQTPAERLLTEEVLPRESFIDDHHARRAIVVPRGEIAASRERDAHRLKIFRSDDVQPDGLRIVVSAAAAVVDFLLILPVDDKAVAASIAADRRNAGQTRRFDAGKAFDALDHSPVKLAALLFRVAQQIDSELRRQYLIGVESRRRALNLPQAAQK